uniref:Checkpoint protein n=1 Tax=Corethrella appendiculata TaxID=1370023 RepID=U5EQJ0_9DIPT
MKFRAVICENNYMRELLNIIITFSKIDKNLIINIKPDKMVFLICSEIESSQALWCEIRANSYFTEYEMTGVDPDESNEIYITLNTANLVRAIAYIKSNPCAQLKLKLLRTDIACLLVEMGVPLETSSSNHAVSHEIPIAIIPRNEWDQFKLPTDIEYDISMALPTWKSLKCLVDKIKNLSPCVTVYARKDGELAFVVETDIVIVTSHYKNLECLSIRSVPSDAGLDEQITEAAVQIDSKRLSTIFDSVNFFDMKVIGKITEEQRFNILFDIRPGVFLNSILPSIALD